VRTSKRAVDPLTDWKGFYDELQEESDRGAAIIAATFLDAQLRELLSRFLIDERKVVDDLLGTDEMADRPLSSFSSRIKAAYCMGLISQSMYYDLEKIRRIRNKFAHEMHGYTFDEQEIVSWCKSLKMAKMLTDAVPHLPNTHRAMFLLGVSQLANWLALVKFNVERDRRSVPMDPSIGAVAHVDERK
jgi:DNA-binding MltR family transcriptional regulator